MACPGVLVVEDDELIRESILDFLEDNGYQAMGAANGMEALHSLGSCQSLPCLIILDLMMPIMDGVSFRHQQVADPKLAKVPVVVVSAYKDVAQQSQDLAVAAHLAKPVKLADLLRLVERHCGHRAST
jgi:CheY-like chemotaxis protein